MNPICFYHKADLDGVCSGVIAKTFGGGGHKGAAGFICDVLPWEVLCPQ